MLRRLALACCLALLAAGTTEYYLRAADDALKPDGVLGVVDHRARPGTHIETTKKGGSVSEQRVIDLAGEVGSTWRRAAKSTPTRRTTPTTRTGCGRCRR